ncbi:MAG: hypothetical protein L3J08_06410 [Flavobacteriaceae bacterium]|nr:hypothetical protein [Flavobacteriaceae bacterium]
MKKMFFVLFTFAILVSCSNDDASIYHYELLPIEDVIVPKQFENGKIYNIIVKYIQPDDCYIHSDVLYEYNDDERNIAVISTVLDDKACNSTEFESEISFKVHALQTSKYIFKFWQGDDDKGNPIYLIKEVPVNN